MNRGGRPPTHGAYSLVHRLDRNRLEPKLRRMLLRLQRSLQAETWETLRGLLIGRLARRELLIQVREQHLLADPKAKGDAWLSNLWGAQRRDTELLALLERMPDPAKEPPSLEAYLASKVPPAAGAPPSAAPQDATAATAAAVASASQPETEL
jgi:hypothetical protein